MDNRRAPGSGDPPRYVSEVGTDTVPVKLVELQAVGGAKRSNPAPIFLVAIAVVGIFAFALGASLATSPAPSPSLPGAAVATTLTTPILSPTASPRPRPTIGPTPEPTPEPTNAHAWTWNRTTVFPGESFGFSGIWTVGDVAIALGRHDADGTHDLWATAVLRPPYISTWDVTPAATAIAELHGVSVIGDRLWAVARVEGVNDTQESWQLVSTTGGVDWTTFGPATGLVHPEGASFIARAGSRWVMGVNGDAAIGEADGHLLFSSDGISWHEASLPKLPGSVDFWSVGRLGEKVLVLGRAVGSGFDETMVVLTSSNGETWRRADFAVPAGGSPLDLACIAELCLTITNSFREPPDPRHLLTTYDGDHWTERPFDVVPDNSDNEIHDLRWTPGGFIAVVGGTGEVVRSFDGVDWQRIPVLPPERAEWIGGVAAAGNVVVAYSQGDADIPPGIWTGLLSALPPAD